LAPIFCTLLFLNNPSSSNRVFFKHQRCLAA
jgi:hypothetical protein